MKLNMIVAVMDKSNIIGINEKLPVKEPVDLQHFKKITTGHIVLMGRKTMESLPKVLSNRVNLVVSATLYNSIEGESNGLTRYKNYNGFIVFNSVDTAVVYAQKISGEDKDLFIIGGQQLYSSMYRYINTLYLTIIEPKVARKYDPVNSYRYFEHVSTEIKSRCGFFFYKLYSKKFPKYFDNGKVVKRTKVKTFENTLHFIEIDNSLYNRIYTDDLNLLLKEATAATNS